LTVIHNGLADIDLNFIADPALDPPCLIMVARFAEPKDHFYPAKSSWKAETAALDYAVCR
jgi:hypothetical protein